MKKAHKITIVRARKKAVAIRVLPHFDADKISDKARKFAFHNGSISTDDVLVVRFRFVRLRHDLRQKKNEIVKRECSV